VSVVMLASPPVADPTAESAGPAPAVATPAKATPLWTVTVDHGGEPLDAELDTNGVDALVHRLGGQVAAVSHRPRRFTTTLRLHGTDALHAATTAADLVRRTADEVGLPAWPLIHLEVVRREPAGPV
jgi:hypothetical protein